jgi:uncharacterized membrane protein HdeD (DUF308 family)
VFDTYEGEAAAARYWWVFIITGLAWLLFSIIVFRWDYTSVKAISILFGIVLLFAGANEMMTLFVVKGGWWKALHAVLGILFIVIGIVAFTKPGNTFAALAAVFSFYLLLRGSFELFVAFATKDVNPLWWVMLITGGIQIGLAFWSAGDFGRKQILLVVWVGLAALFRGVGQMILAFQLRGVKKELAAA